MGLIGFIGSDGTVKNVKLENVNITGSYYVGGVVGYNYGSVTACYWSDYAGNGIGSGNGGETTLVDGTDVTWADAVDAMNAALQNAGSEWRYELTGELPTLKKEE